MYKGSVLRFQQSSLSAADFGLVAISRCSGFAVTYKVQESVLPNVLEWLEGNMHKDHTTWFIDPVLSMKKASAEVLSYMNGEKTYTATTLGGQRLCDS
jgi:hypothetical protein